MSEISLRTYHEQIDALLDENRLADVVAHCHFILQQFPRHLATYRLLGKALLEQNDFTGATDIFQRILSADPEDFIAHVGLAIVNNEEGLLDEARWHMERAFEMDPYNNVIQAELKDLYATYGDGTERLMLTREALARLHVKGELYQQAVAELRESVVDYPDRFDLKTLLAEALWRDEQRVDAVEVCLEVLDALPNCIKANAILAEVWLITGRIAEAQGYLQKIQPMLLLDQEHLDDADSPAAIAFQTEGAMSLPERITLERLEQETLIEADRDESADWVEELDIEGDLRADDLASDTPDWLTALQAASIAQEAASTLESLDDDQESALPISESAYPAEGDEDAWFSLDDVLLAESQTDDYVPDIEPDMMITADDADLPPVPDWMEEAAASVDEEVDESDAAAEEVDEAGFPTWLAAAALAGVAAAHQEPEDDEGEEPLSDSAEAEPAGLEETVVAAQLDAAVPDWLRDIDQDEQVLDEAWLQGPGDDLGTLPEGEDEWSSWLAGEEIAESATTPPGAIQSEEGEGRFEEEKEWEASPMSEQQGMEGYPEEPEDISTPPEDLDDALAWLEGLAARQGARREELPSLQDEDEGDDVDSAYPDWLAGDSDEIPAGVASTGSPEEDEDMAPADIPDWLLESVDDVAEEAAEMSEEDEALAEDLSWLDEIAAGGGSALDEPLTLSWEKDRSEADEAGEPFVAEAGFDAGLSDAAFVAEDAQVDEPPEDLDEAMAWLEQLAARQGADLEELPTVDKRPAEMAMPTADNDSVGLPDWLADIEPAEDEEDDRSLVAAGAAALGAVALGVALSSDEDEEEPEPAPAGAVAGELTDDFPDDPDDALAWLEELARQDEVSEPVPPEAVEPVEEPPTPALPHDVVAAQAAAVAIEAAALQAAAEAQAAAEVAPPAGEQELPGTEDEWIDQIPDDPDAAMAWLEQLAARQGADLDELPTVDEVPEDVELPEWISREVAAAELSLLAEVESEPAVEEPAGVEEPEVVEPKEPELPMMEVEEPVAEPEVEADWQLEMEGEIVEALPDWLSMDLAEVSPELPEEDAEDWEQSHSDVTGWLFAEEEVRTTEQKKEPAKLSWPKPEPEPTPPPPPKPAAVPAGAAAPHLQKAREAMSQGDIDQALDTYQSMLSQGEHLDSLIQELENTQVEETHQPKVHRLLGDAYMQNGDLQKALQVYQDALGML